MTATFKVGHALKCSVFLRLRLYLQFVQQPLPRPPPTSQPPRCTQDKIIPRSALILYFFLFSPFFDVELLESSQTVTYYNISGQFHFVPLAPLRSSFFWFSPLPLPLSRANIKAGGKQVGKAGVACAAFQIRHGRPSFFLFLFLKTQPKRRRTPPPSHALGCQLTRQTPSLTLFRTAV